MIPQAPFLLSRPRAVPPSGFDPATTAWVNAVVSDGGTVSPTQKGYVDTLIVGLKAASLWSAQFDRIWLFGNADTNAHQAKIDIVNLGTISINATETLSASGYTGDGTGGYIDSNYVPLTGGGLFGQNDANIFTYVTNNRTVGAAGYSCGTQEGSGNGFTNITPLSAGGVGRFAINGTSDVGGATLTTSKHSYLATVTGAGAEALYVDGSSYVTSASATTAMSGSSLLFGSARGFGSPTGFDADTIGIAGFGKGMSSGQVTTFEGLINAYATSCGFNVH